MAPVALVLDEKTFRRTLREELEAATAQKSDGRSADINRPDKDWLTNPEAMAYLGLSRMTLQRYRDSGILPYSKVGSNVYYRLSDIHALLERNTQK